MLLSPPVTQLSAVSDFALPPERWYMQAAEAHFSVAFTDATWASPFWFPYLGPLFLYSTFVNFIENLYYGISLTKHCFVA